MAHTWLQGSHHEWDVPAAPIQKVRKMGSRSPQNNFSFVQNRYYT